MPTIGYCHDCSVWVHVRPDWSCPNGHEAARVNGWYDSETGQAVAPAMPPAPAARVAPAAADRAGTRAALLRDMLSTLSQNHAYCAGPGQDTDLIVASNPVDPSWGFGESKAEYSAVLKAIEADHSVHFWEQLTDRAADATRAALESDNGPAADPEGPGTVQDSGIGPGTASWDWGHGTLRRVVEEVAARHGFHVRVELDRQAAVW